MRLIRPLLLLLRLLLACSAGSVPQLAPASPRLPLRVNLHLHRVHRHPDVVKLHRRLLLLLPLRVLVLVPVLPSFRSTSWTPSAS